MLSLRHCSCSLLFSLLFNLLSKGKAGKTSLESQGCYSVRHRLLLTRSSVQIPALSGPMHETTWIPIREKAQMHPPGDLHPQPAILGSQSKLKIYLAGHPEHRLTLV